MKPTRILWKPESIAREFGLDRRTVARRLAESGCKPDTSGSFTTAQVASALFGDMSAAKLAEIRARTALYESRQRILTTEWTSLALVKKVWSLTILTYRQRVLAADVSNHDRNDLLEIMSEAESERILNEGLAATGEHYEDHPNGTASSIVDGDSEI